MQKYFKNWENVINSSNNRPEVITLFFKEFLETYKPQTIAILNFNNLRIFNYKILDYYLTIEINRKNHININQELNPELWSGVF